MPVASVALFLFPRHSDDELLEVDSEAVVTEGTQQDIASSADVMSKISETAETEVM